MANIILASSSPRRRELLGRTNLRFSVMEPPPDTTFPGGVCGDLAVQLIARQKAVAVAEKCKPGDFVVAGDTVVIGPDGVLGKPGTQDRAREMLRMLRGTRHSVLTGICVIAAGTEDEAMEFSRSQVKMRDFSDAEMETYISSNEPLDCAGAYNVNGDGVGLIESVHGRVDAVVGMDVALALKLLAQAGYPEPLPTALDIPMPTGRARRPLAGTRA